MALYQRRLCFRCLPLLLLGTVGSDVIGHKCSQPLHYTTTQRMLLN